MYRIPLQTGDHSRICNHCKGLLSSYWSPDCSIPEQNGFDDYDVKEEEIMIVQCINGHVGAWSTSFWGNIIFIIYTWSSGCSTLYLISGNKVKLKKERKEEVLTCTPVSNKKASKPSTIFMFTTFLESCLFSTDVSRSSYLSNYFNLSSNLTISLRLLRVCHYHTIKLTPTLTTCLPSTEECYQAVSIVFISSFILVR